MPSLWQLLAQTLWWNELSWPQLLKAGKPTGRTLALLEDHQDDLLNWSSFLRHLKWNGMSLSTSPWQLSPPQEQRLSQEWRCWVQRTSGPSFIAAHGRGYSHRQVPLGVSITTEKHNKREDEQALLCCCRKALQDLIILQVYKFRKHGNAPVIKIIEGLIEKA